MTGFKALLGYLKTTKLDRRKHKEMEEEREKKNGFNRKCCVCVKNILHGFHESMAQLAHSISGAMTLVGYKFLSVQM